MTEESEAMAARNLTDDLWEWACRQDQHILDEFGLAIVGLGALLFAYASIHTESLKIIVALIGFAASIILWSDMREARHEYHEMLLFLREEPASSFAKLLEKHEGRNLNFLTKRDKRPANVAITSFMGLVTWAWLAIAIFRISFAVVHTYWPASPSLPDAMNYLALALFLTSCILLVVALTFFIMRRVEYKKR